MALREAILNADYSQRGAFIRVYIFEDRVEIDNPNLVPFGITIEDARKGISKMLRKNGLCH